MRLFISINFSDRVLDELRSIASRLQEGSKKGNFTRRDNFHLTLAFLGEINETKLPRVCEAMDALRCRPFDIRILGLGKFTNVGGDIYWLGIERSLEMTQMHSELTGGLVGRGFYLKKKEFCPHLTLGRGVILKEEFMLDRFTDSLPEISTHIDRIHLMRSDIYSGAVRYSQIYCIGI